MSLTLGLTGMDPATETALRAAFVDANARLGDRWSLLPDAEADHVVVDMDSMYGPMSWLRLHAAGRKVIGLTSAPRTQTDYRLGRPFDTGQMVELLTTIAQASGIRLQAGGTEGTRADAAAAAAAAADARDAQRDHLAAGEPDVDADAAIGTPEAEHDTSAGTDIDVPAAPDTGTAGEGVTASADIDPGDDAVTAPVDMDVADDAVTASADMGPVDDAVTAADVIGGAAHGAPVGAREPEDGASPALPMAGGPPHAGPAATPPAEAAEVARAERTLADWLQPGALKGRRRFAAGRGPVLLIDADAELWHGPATLKPIAPCFDGVVDDGMLEPVEADAWAREAAAAGSPQPLSRLRWLGGLLAGGGALLPGLDPQGRFQLTRWPQTEREFPRHFRIATQMMKGPATVAEIAEASGMPETDVADFVNANLATGFAEPVVEAPAPTEPPKPRGGLLGRLRR